MEAVREFAVTMSPELLKHLRAESKRLKVPLTYVLAGLVVDTLDSCVEPAPSSTVA